MTEIYATMTVAQLKTVKPRRVILLGASLMTAESKDEDFDYVFGNRECFRIHRVSGETTIFDTTLLGEDYSAKVEGLSDDTNVQVPIHLYKQYLQYSRLVQ